MSTVQEDIVKNIYYIRYVGGKTIVYIGFGTTDGFGMYSPLAKGGGEGDSNCC